jgi:hypothetical protein
MSTIQSEIVINMIGRLKSALQIFYDNLRRRGNLLLPRRPCVTIIISSTTGDDYYDHSDDSHHLPTVISFIDPSILPVPGNLANPRQLEHQRYRH